LKLETDFRELKTVELPSSFRDYVDKKLKVGKKGGRPSAISKLGSMDEVLDLLRKLWIEKVPQGKMAKKLGIDPSTLYRFLKDVEPYKEQIIEYLMYIEHVVPKDFRSYKSVQNWENMIRLSGHLSSMNHIAVMEWICTGGRGIRVRRRRPRWKIPEFTCNPDFFDLEKAQEFISLYLKKYNVPKVPRHIIMAIRHFLASKGIVIPRGFGGQYGLSGEKTSYGKYAHVKLSDEQIAKAYEIIASDPQAVEKGYHLAFEIGVQTCARAFAIASIPISKIRREGNLYVLEVFEPKIKEGDEYLGYVGKWWKKYISKSLYAKIQEWIKQHPQRICLFLDKPTKSQAKIYCNGFGKYLKEVYEKLEIKEEYFYKKPIHALRHVGAHRLLRLTDYNYEIVAKLGGWTDAKTLRDCYGEIPEEFVLKIVSRLGEQLNGAMS